MIHHIDKHGRSKDGPMVDGDLVVYKGKTYYRYVTRPTKYVGMVDGHRRFKSHTVVTLYPMQFGGRKVILKKLPLTNP